MSRRAGNTHARQLGRVPRLRRGSTSATSLLALAALALYDTLGWWWADRVAALIVAAARPPKQAHRPEAAVTFLMHAAWPDAATVLRQIKIKV